MARQIDNERVANLVREPFVVEKTVDVEEIAWVLPIEGGA